MAKVTQQNYQKKKKTILQSLVLKILLISCYCFIDKFLMQACLTIHKNLVVL